MCSFTSLSRQARRSKLFGWLLSSLEDGHCSVDFKTFTNTVWQKELKKFLCQLHGAEHMPRPQHIKSQLRLWVKTGYLG